MHYPMLDFLANLNFWIGRFGRQECHDLECCTLGSHVQYLDITNTLYI